MRLTYRRLTSNCGLKRRAQAGRDDFGRWWIGETPLSEHETIILFAVMARRLVPTDDLVEMIWPDPDLEPEWSTKNVHVFVHRLNKKLLGSGWQVRGRMGSKSPGYELVVEPIVAELRLAA